MPTLGDMLGAARRSAAGLQRWIETADPDLAEEVRMAAARAGDSPSGFARAAVADFSRFADEEAWAQLTRIVRDHEDPGTACLAAMVAWRLAATTCERHSS
ncbi:hypothetical protein ACFFTN_27115 [Aminobacter aganoensis]|uniref:N-acyl-L-homoserine lactone synthetase n=1 Tax=Aminobacter aganoensis TaxID=83264 RepID=A0A7X0KNU3_9HYPH|nr:hypothetical protein [Aminobacter aganoensis]MBB6357523.1 N-acyl-L-homoserine lactone synthetase [Aminobacter aganoensis]